MLEHERQPYLTRSLYAILVFLPTCKAYKLLHSRLRDVCDLKRSKYFDTFHGVVMEEKLKYTELLESFKDKILPRRHK